MKNYLRYLYALLAVPLVVLLRFALMPLTGPGIPYVTLFPVTVAVALLAGLGPSVLTGFLGSIIIDYLFVPPLHIIEFDIAHITRTTVVVLTSVFVGYVGDALRAARAKAEKQAHALRESQIDLNRAQAVAHTGSWRLDTQKNELTWSDESYHIFGVPVGTGLTYESFLSYVHPDDRDFVDKKWKAAIAGEKYDIEHRIIVDGKIKWVRERAELELEKDGKLLGGFGTVTDITQRKQMENELRKSHDELELRVKERTADLDETVAELEDQVQQRIVAEEALRSASLYTRGLIEASLDPLVTISPEGKITDVNKATEQVTGLSREKLIGSDFSDYFTKPDKAKEGYKRVLSEGLVRDYPLTIRHISGNEIDVLYNATVYKNEAGEVQGVFAAARDVTERKRMEKALRTASLYARSLIEASLDPLVTISPEGKITDVNKATELATGVNREKLIGSDFSDYFTEPQKANEGYHKVISKGFVRDYPLTIRHTSGSTTDVLYNATVYRNEAGEVQGVFAAARDITARKAAEEKQGVTNLLLKLFARKASRKEYLDSTVKVIRNWSGCEFVGIRIRDNDGNIPYESYVGFDEDFLALENALHLGSDKCVCMRAILQNFQKQERDFISAGGSFYCNDSPAFLNGLSEQEKKEYRGNCIKRGFQSIAVAPIRYHSEVFGAIHLADFKKGMVPLQKIQFIETTISPLIGEAIHRFNAESELEKYRLHLEDLVKQRTDELERSNKDLQQFAYVASHDLQEPLRIIAGYTQLIQQRYKDKLDEDANQFIAFTVESTVRMQNLINDLLSYSRLETRGEAFEPVDCQAVLDEVIHTLRMTIEESGAVIKYGKLPTISADRTQLFQLFQNLIGNAIKFRSDKPPRIHIAAEPQDGRWLFSIKDNGIGIDPKYSERIFVIFQRLHSREKYPGTGIGLAICKKIVERHGGRIWVESQPGKGATFYFII
jgi:PAS domain S-box-containing protein